MNNTESITDHWISQAITHYGKSDAALKKHCVYAAMVVGRYEHGGTQAIATGIKRSISTVQNYAHAFWLYSELRKGKLNTRMRTLWRTLPASHFWQAWTIQQAGYDAYYYLTYAERHNASGREMMDCYKKDIEAGNAPIILQRGVHALRSLATELLNKFGNQFTESQRVALLTIVDNFPD